MAVRVCSIDDCGNRHFGKGFCQKHYQRWRKHGDPLYVPAPRDLQRPCVVDGCDRVDDSRGCGLGMCGMHYQRFRKTGTTDLAPRARRVGVEPCSVDGCGALIKALDLCAKHLTRATRHGSPTARVRAEVVNGRRVCPTCRQDVPLSEWKVRPDNGLYVKCNPCHLEEYRTRNHARRTLLLGGAVEKFSRAEILERDGWVCQLCMKPIDREARHPDPLSASLDHIIPVSLGGDHTRANTQASHFRCNVSKGNRVAIEVAA